MFVCVVKGKTMLALLYSYQHKVMLECVSSSADTITQAHVDWWCVSSVFLGWGSVKIFFSRWWGNKAIPDKGGSCILNMHERTLMIWTCLQSKARWSGRWSALLQRWESYIGFLESHHGLLAACFVFSGMLNLLIWPDLMHSSVWSKAIKNAVNAAPFLAWQIDDTDLNPHALSRKTLFHQHLTAEFLLGFGQCWSSAVISNGMKKIGFSSVFQTPNSID